jgi:hypothetical protein
MQLISSLKTASTCSLPHILFSRFYEASLEKLDSDRQSTCLLLPCIRPRFYNCCCAGSRAPFG